MSTKKEAPVEGEIIDEIKSTNNKAPYSTKRKSGPGIFFGVVFLFWGGALLVDTYFGINLSDNLWPMLAVVFGTYLILSSLKR